MKLKNILTIVLLIFVASGAGYLIIQETGTEPGSQISETASGDKMIVYYFHRTMRCPTCIKIEKYTDEAVKSGFVNELNNQRLEWRIINIEDEGNEHFEEDYRLSAQSVVLAEYKNGKQVKWKNLDKIWDMVGSEEGFIFYIQEEIKSFIRSKS